MTRAVGRTLRPVDACRVERILRRLGALWESRALGGIDVVPNSRLSKALGRLVGRPWRIELSPRALVTAKTLREVVTHEAAHAATRDGAERQPPHGPEWRALMARAGYPEAKGARWRCYKEAAGSPRRKHQPKAKNAPATLYEHWCPVCQSSRVGRRPVKAWRCAVCVAAGLDGRLEITPRPKRPTRPR
jgi:predicted SprT family Zn-dependent metalloprotease